MKRDLVLVAVSGVMLTLGFFAGRAFQHAKTGYHYKILEQKNYTSPLGPIQWTCFLESVGTPFLDTEKTMISIGNRTIYKAQRDFQESGAHARNIETSSNSIKWEDGDFHYHLTMEPLVKGEPTSAANRNQPQRGTNSTPLSADSGR